MKEKSVKSREKLEMDASISIKLPSELLDLVREKSLKTGISISFIARKAFEDWVKENSKPTE